MKNKLNHELAVCGFETVLALERNIDKITRLYFTADRAPALGSLCSALARKKIPYNQVASPDELQKLCGSIHHQGIVAMIDFPESAPVTEAELSEWATHKAKVLLLDRIGNANNFGAILRSAAFFGFAHVVIPEDEQQALITTSAYRVAQGGMESVAIYAVRSSAAFLDGALGRFVRVGSDANSGVLVRTLAAKTVGRPVILVLGNEETGISRAVSQRCDMLAAIQSPVSDNKIDSLNVAQAASVLMYALREFDI
jgi:TrmH RNA methyltransferase